MSNALICSTELVYGFFIKNETSSGTVQCECYALCDINYNNKEEEEKQQPFLIHQVYKVEKGSLNGNKIDCISWK